MNFKNLNTKSKKALFGFGVVVVIVAILALIFWIELNKDGKFLFLAKVPDYSTPKGYAIVSIKDYEKYQQGYCLREDRILDKEEIIKRGIVDKNRKMHIVNTMMVDELCKFYGKSSKWCAYGNKKHIDKIGFHIMSGFDYGNWLDIIVNEYSKSTLDDLFFNKFKAQKIELKTDDIVINGNKATFKQPLLYYSGEFRFSLYPNSYYYYISPDSREFSSCAPLFIAEGYTIDKLKAKIKEFYSSTIIGILPEDKGKKIDNCGNYDWDIEYFFNADKNSINKGG